LVTKPELALDMITGAVAAGVPAAWVASDEVYGDNGAFRADVAKLGLGYVLAVSCDHRIPGLLPPQPVPPVSPRRQSARRADGACACCSAGGAAAYTWRAGAPGIRG
jgi:SRSO17 transposase